MKKTWFYQDGATTYGTNVVLKILKEKFGQQVISCWEIIAWPPRSLDITSCDFFCEGMRRVRRIEAIIKGISKQLLEDVAKTVHHHFREYLYRFY